MGEIILKRTAWKLYVGRKSVVMSIVFSVIFCMGVEMFGVIFVLFLGLSFASRDFVCM